MTKPVWPAWVVVFISLFLIIVTFNGINTDFNIGENSEVFNPDIYESTEDQQIDHFETVTNSNPSTRSRYLKNDIVLDDPAVQLNVVSEDGNDNYYGNLGNGQPIATGDINNDGYDDMILGSPFADGYTEGVYNAGQVMVIFGQNQTHPNTIYDQADKDSKEIHLIIHGGKPSSYLGFSIVCGDLDGDSYDDIILGAPYADGRNDARINSGEIYVFYGKPRDNFGANINLQNTAPDLIIYGAQGGAWPNYDVAGFSLAVGNVLGDSKDDLIIGAPYANALTRTNTGCVFIVAGDTRANLGTSIDLRTNADVRIIGMNANDYTGVAVAAGDINGDARDDILVGAYGQETGGRTASGAAHIVYGAQSLSSDIDLVSDADVTLFGADSWDYFGYSVAVGNLNGDQYDDAIVSSITGDGQNDALASCGDVYIFYGSNSLSSTYDTNSNDQDIVIYGRDAGDYLGYSLATGNVNNDGYDDILVGALIGDGYLNGNSNAGETYLVLGNSTANLGSNIDLSNKAESVFYGVDDDDRSGRYVQLGDLDGDSHDDIIIFAERADGPNNARDLAGEFYLIYSLPPHIKNEYLMLLDGDINNKTIHAKYKDYTFRINSTNILGFKDFKSFTLVIDPMGYNIMYNWSRKTKQFNEVYDPKNLVTLNTTGSTATHDGKYNYIIDFRFIFNWNFNKDGPLDCEIITRGKRSLVDKDTYPEVFKVNSKLNFKGTLKVTGDIQGNLKDDDWVAGGEKLKFSGLKVIYNGTSNFYPPSNTYSLGIEDNMGITNVKVPSPGSKFEKTIKAFKLTMDNLYTLRILDVGKDTDQSSESIRLKIDADIPDAPNAVYFKADSQSELDNVEVDDDTEVFVSWDEVEDIGSGTTGYYYSFIDRNGTDNGTLVDLNKVKLSDLVEGENKVYVWTTDAVGNIGGASWNQVFIDLTEVTFNSFTPESSQDQWFNSNVVDCSIKVYDTNGFGIDPTSIEYWEDYSKTWVPIITAPGSINPKQMNLQLPIKFQEGIETYTQFKVSDLAGNGPTLSAKYSFKIDTTLVNFTEPRPEPTKKLGTQQVKCEIIAQDLGGSGVDLSTIQYSYTTSGLVNFTDWTDTDLALSGRQTDAEESSKWFVQLKFKRGAENYIRWRAMDIAGNGYAVSKNYSVMVNALPTIIVDEPTSEMKLTTKTDIVLRAEDTYDMDDKPEDLYFYWSSNISSHLGNEKTITTKLPAGQHEITLRVFDGLNTASYSFNITVDQAKKKDTEEGGLSVITQGSNLWILLLIIIIIIMALIFLVVFKKETRKRKVLEEKLISARAPAVSRYQPMTPPKPAPVLRGPGAPSEPFPVTDKPYEVTAKPEIKQLPTVGGTSASAQLQPTVAPSVGATPTVITGEAGQQIPQLPPAQPTIAAPPTQTTTQPQTTQQPEAQPKPTIQDTTQQPQPTVAEPKKEEPEVVGLTPDSPEFQKKMKEGEKK